MTTMVATTEQNTQIENAGKQPRAKISRRQFVRRFAKEAGLSIKDAEHIYEIFLKTLQDTVRTEDIVLTGFGRFYAQRHKGHPVRFSGEAMPPEYSVLKFSATRDANKFLDLTAEEAEESRVPGTSIRRKPGEKDVDDD